MVQKAGTAGRSHALHATDPQVGALVPPMVLQGCLGVIRELGTHIKEEGEGENDLAQPGRAVGAGALRDVPSVVLDPEVAAKLHSLVCGAELWGVVRPVKASRREQGGWASGAHPLCRAGHGHTWRLL